MDDLVVFCKAASVHLHQPRELDPCCVGRPRRSNMLNAPFPHGLFVGDYLRLAAAGLNAWAVFGAAEVPNRTAEFVRHIVLPGLGAG
jgi:hypothetical protein